MEDGRFEIAIVEEMPANDLLTETAIQRLFGEETKHVAQFTSEHVEITTRQDNGVEFSLDGEIRTHRQLSLHTLPQTLEIVVGPEYTPQPEEHPLG